jgi:hypothetical protein
MTQQASMPANQTRRPQPCKCQVSQVAPSQAVEHAPWTYPPSFHSVTLSSYHQGANLFLFCSEAHWEGIMSPLEVQRCYNKALQHSHLVAITPMLCAVTCILMAHLESTAAQCMAAAAQYHPCAPPFLLRGILLQLADCLQNEGECGKQCIYHRLIRYIL